MDVQTLKLLRDDDDRRAQKERRMRSMTTVESIKQKNHVQRDQILIWPQTP